MLTLPAAAQLHFARENQRVTVCGIVFRRDGTELRCTQHDQDIEIAAGDLAGFYSGSVPITGSDIQSGSDLSADNLEVSGRLTDSLVFSGFTAADIESGLFDSAAFETFLVQWDDPDAWQKPVRRGYLGEIKRTAEGSFQAEWRGLVQALAQSVGRTYAETCDVRRFGDARCGLDILPLELAGTIASVVSRRHFVVSLDSTPVPTPAAGYFELGEIRFTTGANVNREKQIKRDSVGGPLGDLELWESFAADVQVGDRAIVRPGCDRRFETCQRFDNTVNFRGHGRWMPGIPKILRAP